MSEAHSSGEVLIGDSGRPERLRLDRANRHGLVAGATGTGKTVTLQILAQGLSDAGVPVFAADVKGAPTVVRRTLIRPPASRLGPLSPGERAGVMAASPVKGVYDAAIDRESARDDVPLSGAFRRTRAPDAACVVADGRRPRKRGRPRRTGP